MSLDPTTDAAFMAWFQTSGAGCLLTNPLINAQVVVQVIYAGYLAGRAEGYAAGERWLQDQREQWLRN